jgi:hypothetical protein
MTGCDPISRVVLRVPAGSCVANPLVHSRALTNTYGCCTTRNQELEKKGTQSAGLLPYLQLIKSLAFQVRLPYNVTVTTAERLVFHARLYRDTHIYTEEVIKVIPFARADGVRAPL